MNTGDLISHVYGNHNNADDIKLNSVMIFDDKACAKQNFIRNYFIIGRHNDVDTFYLRQNIRVVTNI